MGKGSSECLGQDSVSGQERGEWVRTVANGSRQGSVGQDSGE